MDEESSNWSYVPYTGINSPFYGTGSYFSEPSVFSDVFTNIKEKIFLSSECDDIELTVSENQEYEAKYNVPYTSISDLKKNITHFYTKKIEFSLLIEERRRLFNTFCNNISNSINCINDITKEDCSIQDHKLKDLLNDRIDWYYKKLDIDNLIDTEYSIKSEFHFLKKTLIELSEINPTICMICMEKQISWFIDPCGHTLCTDCKLRTDNSSSCHYCRALKNKLNRLYL